MKKETLIWQAIVLIILLLLVLTIREYLLDKNEITSSIGNANCVIEAKKVGLEGQDGFCENINTYKLKLNE